MYLVYILKSENFNKTYTGITDNLERRLTQHNQGYSLFSSRYRPWKIIHLEKYETRIQARIREKYLKSAAGRKWIKMNLFNN